MSEVQNNLFNLQANQSNQANLLATSTNPLFNNDSATNRGLFWLIKLTLMLINAFTGMIGIFIVLFGFAYPEEKFPGDLKGKNCALLSIVYIGWTLIGYCGAHHQKFYFLLVYSGLVVFYVFTNIIIFGALAPKYQWIDANLFWIMCGYFTILMAFAMLLAYQIRLKEERSGYYDDTGYMYGSTVTNPLGSNPIPNTNYNQMAFYNNNLQNDPSNMFRTMNIQNYNTAQNVPSYSNINASPSSGNYFQRNWQRMSSKKNFFRPNNYRLNGNLISTEMKPLAFNTSLPQY